MNKFRSERFYHEENKKHPEGIRNDAEHYLIVIEAAYQKALQTETNHIDEREFTDIYGETQVEQDRKHIHRLRLLHQHTDLQHIEHVPIKQDPRKLGRILEAIITEQIELNEWFGPGTNTLETTDFDDYENGIDTIVEFNLEEGRNHMGLAFDTTYASRKK